MRVGIAQFRASKVKSENLEKIIDFIRAASRKGVDLIVFPEYSMVYPIPKDSPASIAESIDGPFISRITDEARRNRVSVVVNFCEVCSENSKKVYDTSVLISSEGKVLLTYRKTHLFDAFKFKESALIEPGKEITGPVRLDDFNIGLLICYDIRFPEAARVLALRGCNLLCVSSAWFSGVLKEEHLLTTLRSRAIENGFYVVMANQIGPTFCGRSSIIDPFGVKLVDAGDEECMVYADLGIERVEKVRSLLPLLRQRRPELYLEVTRS